MSHNQLINMSQNGRPRGRHRTGDAEPGITVTHRLTGDSVTREGPRRHSRFTTNGDPRGAGRDPRRGALGFASWWEANCTASLRVSTQ